MSQQEIKDKTLSVPPKPQKQTAVYVTGLSDDTTIDELFEHFSKVGVIMDDMFTGTVFSISHKDYSTNP